MHEDERGGPVEDRAVGALLGLACGDALGTKSFPTVCEMYTPDGDLAAEGSSTLVVGEEGSRPIPDEWREALVAFEPALEAP